MSIFEQPKHVYKFGLMRARWLAVCKYKITGFGLYSVYSVHCVHNQQTKPATTATGGRRQVQSVVEYRSVSFSVKEICTGKLELCLLILAVPGSSHILFPLQ